MREDRHHPTATSMRTSRDRHARLAEIMEQAIFEADQGLAFAAADRGLHLGAMDSLRAERVDHESRLHRGVTFVGLDRTSDEDHHHRAIFEDQMAKGGPLHHVTIVCPTDHEVLPHRATSADPMASFVDRMDHEVVRLRAISMDRMDLRTLAGTVRV